MSTRVLFSFLLLAVAGCARREPPGADRPNAPERIVGTGPADRASPTSAPAAGEPRVEQRGSLDDNLPFVPTGTRLASIAWRTWIYTDVGPKRTRYGYLRSGGVLEARGPALVNEGCPGGWYRINPRGFVCVGMGATLDLQHPIAVASTVRPLRQQGLPYLYALAGDSPPLLYFRLASLNEMEEAEGSALSARIARFRERVRQQQGVERLLGKIGPPPEFLTPKRKLEKPYGTQRGLHYSAHAGRAAPDSGFSLAHVFEWQTRLFGLTTELELIGLDRTKIVQPSEFHGVELGPAENLPVAFVMPRFAQKFVEAEDGELVARGAFGYREGLKLTGQRGPAGMLQAQAGIWAVEPTLRIVNPRSGFPSMATGDRKWIDISIQDQTLVAYLGRRPVYVTLVSTGRGGLGDPETEQATVRGTFMIYQKEVTSTMDGEDDAAADSYALRDVPFVQYFHKGFALHGTYWHDDFGKQRSHGCINLAPIDAAWLFEWTDPAVPAEWHGVLNKERGTVVYVRP